MEFKQKKDKKDTCKKKPIDPHLDITSIEFDPLKALYTPDFRVTKKHPKVLYQNLAALETALNKTGIWGLNVRSNDGHPSTSKQIVNKDDQSLCRRFQNYQMPTKTEIKLKNKHRRNLIKQMEHAKGPLKQLNNYIIMQQKVRVIVRKEHGIKGYVIGYVQCFDRHWNLLLKEVEECYQQRKYKYAEQKLPLLFQSTEKECLKRLHNLGITLPAQNVKSLNRKTVEIKRYIPQLLLRGEHVVLIHTETLIIEKEKEKHCKNISSVSRS